VNKGRFPADVIRGILMFNCCYSLISESENISGNKGFQGLRLTVYHLNRNAILFYKKQDYKIIGKTVFEMENQKYENKIMFKKFME
jgi:ribosomal protein S18 acetylase RimI-like enzyme